MSNKWKPYLLILLLAGILLVVKFFKRPQASTPQTKSQSTDPSSTPNRNRGFDRRISYIEYTQHARCRMECRQISQSEVEEIMKKGTINYKKSDVHARPCPSYALEGTTHDNQRVRIVFGQCDLKTKVITCIDLNTDWECDCPGDDDKYKNRK